MRIKNNCLVSIIIPIRNSGKLLKKCLESISNQSYKEIEIVVSDGGSRDNGVKIAREYNAKIINNPDILAEPGIYYGMKVAKGELLIVLAVDNEFKKDNAIENIVEIFRNHEIFAAFPVHGSSKNDSIYSKYINTFTDPFNHFIYGYAANGRTFHKIYRTLLHTRLYDIYDYSSNSVRPIIALAQGFIVRSEFVKMRSDKFDDITPVYDLLKKKKRIAFLHGITLLHHTIRNLGHFMRKQRWAVGNSLKGASYGINFRKKTLTRKQKILIYFFPIYSFCIILPILRSLYGFVSEKEKIWLVHPFITFIAALAITYEFAKIKLGFDNGISRQ